MYCTSQYSILYSAKLQFFHLFFDSRPHFWVWSPNWNTRRITCGQIQKFFAVGRIYIWPLDTFYFWVYGVWWITPQKILIIIITHTARLPDPKSQLSDYCLFHYRSQRSFWGVNNYFTKSLNQLFLPPILDKAFPWSQIGWNRPGQEGDRRRFFYLQKFISSKFDHCRS